MVHIDFSVLGVTRDGQPTPYTVESIADGQRIKIGDADTDLTPGTYTYAITYVADREIGFFDKYDELYWNVTGTQWKFAIEHAEATIHLPPHTPPAPLPSRACHCRPPKGRTGEWRCPKCGTLFGPTDSIGGAKVIPLALAT